MKLIARVSPHWWVDLDGFRQSSWSLGRDRGGGASESMHLKGASLNVKLLRM